MGFFALPHAAQAALSSYGLYHSYQCITKLRQYEERSEKAAKYSNTAAEQLRKTRTTQASAAIAVISSLVSSIALLVFDAPSTSSGPSFMIVAQQALNLAVQLAARAHVKEFWDNKAKVPFVEGYNEAISGTTEIVRVLGLSGGLWAMEIGLMGLWAVKRTL